MKSVEQRILDELEKARKRLLDLSMRNRLLNFTPTKRSTVQIVFESPAEVFSKLVMEQLQMVFKCAPSRSGQDEGNSLEGYVPNERELTDKYLQTDLGPKELEHRLLFIKQKSDSVLEEQGYTVLYLALGFLYWKESKDELTIRRSPLVLIPVALDRPKVGSAFRVKWTEEDITTNISLKAKLDEFGIKLPEFESPEEKGEIDGYFKDVVKVIKGQQGWEIQPDIFLGFFSFTKFVMYRDLKPVATGDENRLVRSPLLHSIFIGTQAETNSNGIGEGLMLDEERTIAKIPASKQFHVLDADASQVAVIEAAKSGKNMVVEGPPGTGKSQTITNIIAELLGIGKTVIFVSEKMAALEVVKARLQRCGLGDACLELHSRYANKRAVLEELQRTLMERPPADLHQDKKLDEREKLVVELDDYANVLSQPIGLMQRTPYSLIGQYMKVRTQIERQGNRLNVFRIHNVEQLNDNEYGTSKALLYEIVSILPNLRPLSTNPWRYCHPGTLLLDSDCVQIDGEIKDAARLVLELQSLLTELDQVTGIGTPKDLQGARDALDAAHIIESGQPTDPDILLNAEWNEPNASANHLIETTEYLQKERSAFQNIFRAEAITIPANTLHRDFEEISTKWLKFFMPGFWTLRKQALALHQKPTPIQQLLTNLKRLVVYQETLAKLAGRESEARRLFGRHWHGIESDVTKLRGFADWVVRFRQSIIRGYLTVQAVSITSHGPNAYKIRSAVDAVKMKLVQLEGILSELNSQLNFVDTASKVNPVNEMPFVDLTRWLTDCRAKIVLLPRWAQFASREDQLRNSFAAPLIESMRSDSVEPEHIVPILEASVAEGLLRVGFEKYPILQKFVAEVHERRIADFVNIDKALQKINQQRLARKLYAGRPTYTSLSGVRESEAGILLGQLNRKRGHMPIRKLLGRVGHLIQRIKPCFMMSPLSIAQFLDPATIQFDTVIFDEASQVRPEDALGSLLRGKQLIVMGDTRQLPPTSFFDKLDSANDEDDEDAQAGITDITDVESILHQCKMRNFLRRTLRWHYRSHHESLIAVSNEQFYNNQLLVYPSIEANVPGIGLELRPTTGSIYDRGKSAQNRIEARIVVDAALEHYRKTPNKSLGIGTFSLKQQEAILDELEMKLRANPEMQEYFNNNRPEYCFIKNLETIQGDERDVIFVSMGYGRGPDGRVIPNFGPVNKDGGHRRLNVLMTRARDRCVLFSNFGAEDLPIVQTTPVGVRALKRFLEYAKDRSSATNGETMADTESPFEDSVKEFLESKGFVVRTQIGCAEFRIDLAIVDSDHLGRYLLAVECDGRKYHTSPVARDRDRLRQQVLENMGWRNRIHRIWSTDWFHNPDAAKQKLLDAVENSQRLPGPGNALRLSEPHANQVITVDPIVRVKQDIQIENNGIQYSEPYKPCKSTRARLTPQLYDSHQSELVKAIQHVVEIESPVHMDEVIHRIRVLCGIGRTGSRIRSVMEKAINVASRQGKIRKKGKFLWSVDMIRPQVRSRNREFLVNANMISDEEVEEAILAVLRSHYATEEQALARHAARLLGFHNVQERTAKRVARVLSAMLKVNRVQQNQNKMVEIVQDSQQGQI